MISIGLITINKLLRSFGFKVVETDSVEGKYEAEVAFWREELDRCKNWYSGKGGKLWGVEPPSEKEIIEVKGLTESVVKTWLKLHQQKKYLVDLDLKKDTFRKMSLLDIGSGPYPSASVFEDSDLYCLDPLLPEYIKAGYPIYSYENSKFVYGFGERIPFHNKYFDAVISVNALDHVDDFEKTAKEIGRILKVNGKIRVHLHYHQRTTTEPIELNDDRVSKAFDWCKGFRKISESQKKSDYVLTDKKEKYVIWSNFE